MEILLRRNGTVTRAFGPAEGSIANVARWARLGFDGLDGDLIPRAEQPAHVREGKPTTAKFFGKKVLSFVPRMTPKPAFAALQMAA